MVPTVTPYYDQDGITIYHADCADALPSIDPATVDLLLTDPPYGIKASTDYRRMPGGDGRGGNAYVAFPGDDSPFDPGHLLRFGRAVLWGANHYAAALPSSPSWLVWDKRDGLGANMFADCELAWSNLGGPARLWSHRWQGQTRDSERRAFLHPTQKPVALMRWIVDRWTEPGDLILDPYMGSGPIAAACADLGRRYIGIEIEEHYCEVTVTHRLTQGRLPL